MVATHACERRPGEEEPRSEARGASTSAHACEREPEQRHRRRPEEPFTACEREPEQRPQLKAIGREEPEVREGREELEGGRRGRIRAVAPRVVVRALRRRGRRRPCRREG